MPTLISGRFLIPLAAMTTSLHAQTWQVVATPGPLDISTSRAIASDGSHLYVLGGVGGYGVHRTTDGSSWQTINAVKGTSAYDLSLVSMDFISVADGRIWVGNDPGSHTINYGYHPIHRLEPGETQWTPSAATGFPGTAMASAANGVAHDPVSGNYLAASILGGMYTSSDRVNWQRRTDGLGTGLVLGYSVFVKNGVAFLNQTNGNTHRSTDGGVTWTAATGMTSSSPFIDTGERIVVANAGTIFGTSNLGATWDNLGSLVINAPIDLTTDGSTLFATQGFNYLTSTPMMNYSSTGGVTWGGIPATGLPAGFIPVRIIPHGGHLYAFGIVGHNGPSGLYRVGISSLDLKPILGVASHPKAVVALEGRPVTLSVIAGGSGPLSYQWLRNGVAVDGQTSATLSFPSSLASQSGSYTVRVTDGNGATVTSNAAAVSIMPSGDGRYDPLMTRTGISSSTSHGRLHALPDGSVLGIQDGRHLFKIGPDGDNIAQRSLPTACNIQFIDSQNRLIVAADSGIAVAMRRVLLDSPGFPDDPAFPAALTPNSTVRGITEIPGTGYVVVGAFTSISGTAVGKVALVSYSGVVTPFLSTTPPSQITGVHYSPQDGGSIWIDGSFGYPVNFWPGTSSSSIIRLDVAGNVAAGWRDYPYSSSEYLSILAIQPDGKPLVKSGQRIIRLNTDGTRDMTFNSADAIFGTGNAAFNHVALQPDGKVIVAGNFVLFNSQSTPGRYCRLNEDGTLDATFYVGGGYSTSAPITGLAYDPRGYAYLTCATATTTATFQGVGSIGRGVVRVFATSQGGPASAYDAWAAALPEDKRAWNVDADGDGFSNVFDFLFGGSPTAPDALGPFIKPAENVRTTAQILATDAAADVAAGKTYQTVTFRIPKNLHGFTAVPQAAGNQLNFNDGSARIHQIGPAVDDGAYELRTYYITPAREDSNALFWRLRITG